METITLLSTDQILLPEQNMRTTIDRDSIFELAEDIKVNGLISPITVRPKGNMFELVAGQRRLLAHQYAGIVKIKCIVKQLSDDEAFAIMTSENLARVDVNPVDESNHVGRLLTLHNGDIEKVAKIVNRGQGWVRDRMLIAEMPDYMQEYLLAGTIKLGVAIALMEIDDPAMRETWTFLAVRDGVSIAQAKYWVEGWKLQTLPGGQRSELPPEGYVPGAPTPILFECALDGNKYDSRQFHTVFIHESNLDTFNVIASELRSQARSAESTA